MMKHMVLALFVAVAATSAACSSDAALPACTASSGTSTLTYANFGQAFMTSYCTNCHGQYGSLSGVNAEAGNIVSEAGTGTKMPEGGTKPSSAERAKLTEWLSCGAK